MKVKFALPIMRSVAGYGGSFEPLYTACDAESNGRFYDARGDIYSCILSVGNKKAAVGSYFPDYIVKTESMLTRNIETVPECSQCKLSFLCGGGCAYSIIDESGDVLRPNCGAINNALFRDLPTLSRR